MKILISIIGFNRVELTKACINSVLRAGGEFDLYLTDNGSKDGTAMYFHELGDSEPRIVRLVFNEANEGFIPPNNAAYLWALKEGYTHLILLNNDTLVPKGWLERIREEFERHPVAALVGAGQTCCALHESMHGYASDVVEYIDGACLAIDLAKVSRHFPDYLFSPYLEFAYGEDSDLSLRMRQLGYSIHQANVAIVHARGSTSKFVPKVQEYMLRNHEVLREIWAPYLKTRKFGQRIVIRRWASHGDVLLITPIIRALWERYKLSKIYVVTHCGDVLAHNPCVFWVGEGILPKPDDMLIDLDMSSENAPMRHFVTSYARTAGIEDPPHQTEIYWRDEDLPAEPMPPRAIALHADLTTWPGKNWPEDRWLELAKRLRKRGHPVVLVGRTDGPRRIPCDIDIRNETNLQQLAAALSQCAGFVGHDSFPMHAAGAVGIPTVGIFGVTASKYILSGRGPQIGCDADALIAPTAGLRHRVAGKTFIEEDGTAIRTVTVNQVYAAITSLVT